MDTVATIWIDRGAPVPGLHRNPFPNLDMPFRYYGLVEINCSRWGTAIRWDPDFAKDWSIQNVVDRLSEWPRPYTLIYYKQGWFKETQDTPAMAANRMLHVQSLDNVQILNAAHVKNIPLNDQTLLPWLRAAQHNHGAFREYGVEDIVDERDGSFHLNFVGAKSPFQKYVCSEQDSENSVIPGNEHWIRKVETVYANVLDTWEPRLDYVVAAVNSHDDEPIWRSWHRMVTPIKTDAERFGVRCFVALAPVDFGVI